MIIILICPFGSTRPIWIINFFCCLSESPVTQSPVGIVTCFSFSAQNTLQPLETSHVNVCSFHWGGAPSQHTIVTWRQKGEHTNRPNNSCSHKLINFSLELLFCQHFSWKLWKKTHFVQVSAACHFQRFHTKALHPTSKLCKWKAI